MGKGSRNRDVRRTIQNEPGATSGIPYRCDLCGFEFREAGMFQTTGDAQFVQVWSHNTIWPCRRLGCDGMARQVLNGSFTITPDGAWELIDALQPQGVTLGDYERALEAIRAAEGGGDDATQMAASIEAAAPALRRFARWVRDHPGAAVQAAGALASVYAAIIATASYNNDRDARNDLQPQPLVQVDVSVQAPPIPEAEISRIVQRELQCPIPER